MRSKARLEELERAREQRLFYEMLYIFEYDDKPNLLNYIDLIVVSGDSFDDQKILTVSQLREYGR